ncbi:MAG: twin-arginine translocase TatA/TatE family subunit [Hyphomicrobiales bacterium]|nr:twin-arginine translocase TatA/TatE family subunit [Hyphomicrobiales bacterium]MCY4048177.1 twin-arginine translocase TatA/TatE family subunit [Hyphomicrobiales bacterium]MCY4053807.1 twin-arginine translocase TatA/TatE family subunit [Hyphomicrobiales bacterium]
MGPGWLQILLVVALVLVLFGGRGKISSLMGDVAKGIKSFRSGLSEAEKMESDDASKDSNVSPKVIEHEAGTHENVTADSTGTEKSDASHRGS